MRNGKPHHHQKKNKKNRDLFPPRSPSSSSARFETGEHHASSKKPKEFSRESTRDFAREMNRGSSSNKGDSYWIYGHHALEAALKNPDRTFKRLVHTGHKNLSDSGQTADRPAWELLSSHEINTLLPRDAVHQGVAGLTIPLEEPDIEDLCQRLTEQPKSLLLLLDQVTDPHNVGAILRSAAAFGADAVILTERHAAPQSGVLAKAASGALEIVPLCRVTNLARTMEIIKQAGFWCVGLAGEAEKELGDIDLKGKVALIMGSEESGLRRLTRENSDFLARLPTQGPIDQLNVSNAAAIALYEVKRQST